MIIKASFAAPAKPGSAIDMAVHAAKNCLARAAVAIDEVDLLINIGVFRDENIIEPAIAPLIQKALGMNLDPVGNGHLHRSTFSFDITDGECGFLTAARVANSFLKNKQAKYALIVSGDIHPSQSDHPDFPFNSVACAVLLTAAPKADRGFQNFQFKTSANGSNGFSANVDLSQNGAISRQCMTFTMDEQYHRLLSVFTTDMLKGIVADGIIDPAEIHYVVTSQHTAEFGAQMARSFQRNGHIKTVDLHEHYGNPHTSSLILGYHQLICEGRVRENDRILFVGAGAGLSAACALYVV
ncbi:MAG: 3-oxoacyl-[acyl-carrier-protein] synthase III C-terminal domain-containing protein [Smithellaceae bacterium]